MSKVEEKRYRCHICPDKVYRTKGGLGGHMYRVHGLRRGEYPFIEVDPVPPSPPCICYICRASLPTVSDLGNHLWDAHRIPGKYQGKRGGETKPEISHEADTRKVLVEIIIATLESLHGIRVYRLLDGEDIKHLDGTAQSFLEYLYFEAGGKELPDEFKVRIEFEEDK